MKITNKILYEIAQIKVEQFYYRNHIDTILSRPFEFMLSKIVDFICDILDLITSLIALMSYHLISLIYLLVCYKKLKKEAIITLKDLE